MLAEAIDQVIHQDETERIQFIQAIAVHPETYLDELTQILAQFKSPRWSLAAAIFEAIGYPQNAQAIPSIVSHLVDINIPSYSSAVNIIKNLPPEAVIPHVIAILWDKGDEKGSLHLYLNDISGLSGVISSYDRRYALACGPLVASLMSRYLHQLELEPMLWVIEAIGPEESLYALPVVIEIARTNPDPDTRTLAQQLLDRYPPEIRVYYARV